eukprot:CAMPEP_0184663516 /NCGR_PEP_ID=MMETSP0308-20130426/48432_1 /TAXON_ID=38269 /ORGANISM="Gloeochaete witrockiana, Strain SAG 46.84" /LENGTH=915 /DNA_ID=CAMNT_0027106289 /DNA_START=61 /DNA_END=2805 /DNA_ORIENTATION=-
MLHWHPSEDEGLHFDAAKYGDVISWDSRSFFINGKRELIVSGEFHYWRVPDRDRWEPILRTYKAGGLNAIRVYFHWGYHSPSHGVYHFDGNRDVDYMLSLCESIGLWVLAAPGPYICAETSGGGFPGWVATDRSVRVRNMLVVGVRVLDEGFMSMQREWYQAIIPILAKHEITRTSKTGARGCVLALQVENELLDLRPLPVGLNEEMRRLAVYAREFGSSVPIFSNDPKPWGSWNPHRYPDSGIDIYGFDLYLFDLLPPMEITKGMTWKTRASVFGKSVDGLGELIRSYGYGAASGPLFIPELQGGWFCPWGCAGFDNVYEYYGDEFQRLLLDSLLVQGFSAVSFYMYYGGTNWGTIGDADGHSSYDYSGAIREYGFVSLRLRLLRQHSILARCFKDTLFAAEQLTRVTTSLMYRRSAGNQSGIVVVRNLESSGDLQVEGFPSVPFAQSFLSVENAALADGIVLVSSAVHLLAWGKYNDGQLLIAEARPQGSIKLRHANAKEPFEVACSEPGLARAATASPLYVACLTKDEALTLVVDLRGDGTLAAAWGTYDLDFHEDGKLLVHTWGRQQLTALLNTAHAANGSGLLPLPSAPIPSAYSAHFGSPSLLAPKVPVLQQWTTSKIHWANVEWQRIGAGERHPLDHGFFAGTVLYKCEFSAEAAMDLYIWLNVRHHCTLWLNDLSLGGHITYSLGEVKPGSHMGLDPSMLGAKRYDLRKGLLHSGRQTLVIATDGFGMGRQPIIYDDVRNPRGILQVGFGPPGLEVFPEWHIAGVDARTLDQTFSTNNIDPRWYSDATTIVSLPQPFVASSGIVRYTSSFVTPDTDAYLPLRIHVSGNQTAFIWLNKLLIGHYVGDVGPQHDFFVIPGFLTPRGTANFVDVEVYARHDVDDFEVSLKSYVVNSSNGNIDEAGGQLFW